MQAHQEIRIADPPSAGSGSSAIHRPSGTHYSLQAVLIPILNAVRLLTNIWLGHDEIWAVH